MNKLRIGAVVLGLLVAVNGSTQEQDFFKGKVIHVIVGSAPGGGFDTYSRMIARHMGRHIPGNPTIIVDNMPGAGFLKSLNHLYHIAKPDGLTIGNWIGTMVMAQMVGRQGINYDVRRFEYVGSQVKNHDTCVLTKASGITSIDKWLAAKTPVKLGATPPGATPYDTAAILREALGLPTQIVAGYNSTREVTLASESGEVSGLCGFAWASVKTTWRTAIESGNAIVVTQNTPKAHPELPNVPLAIMSAKTDEARRMIQLGIHDVSAITYVYSLPPKTPKARVDLLRRAFTATMKDPEFLTETKKANLEIDPQTGEQIEKTVKGFFDTDPAMIKKFAKILQ